MNPSPYLPQSPRRLLAVWAALALPSLGMAQKYGGVAGCLAYLLLSLTLLALLRAVWIRWERRCSAQTALWLTVAAFCLLAAAFIVLYPLANGGRFGAGSDRDDALNLAVRRLFHGEHPYHALTYLGNPISPMPGALLLAAPFVLLGSSAYQNLFWLAAFVLFLAKSRRPTAGLLLLGLLALCPEAMRELLTGGDYLANSLYVPLAAALLLERARAGAGQGAPAAALLGVCLSSRPHFLLIIPLLGAALFTARGARPAMLWTGITLLVFAGVTLPIYLWDPHGFTPLHAASKLTRLESILPHAALLTAGVSGAAAMLLALRQRGEESGFWADCALALALAPLALALLESAALRRPYFAESGYGLAATIPAVLAHLDAFHASGTEIAHG